MLFTHTTRDQTHCRHTFWLMLNFTSSIIDSFGNMVKTKLNRTASNKHSCRCVLLCVLKHLRLLILLLAQTNQNAALRKIFTAIFMQIRGCGKCRWSLNISLENKPKYKCKNARMKMHNNGTSTYKHAHAEQLNYFIRHSKQYWKKKQQLIQVNLLGSC